MSDIYVQDPDGGILITSVHNRDTPEFKEMLQKGGREVPPWGVKILQQRQNDTSLGRNVAATGQGLVKGLAGVPALLNDIYNLGVSGSNKFLGTEANKVPDRLSGMKGLAGDLQAAIPGALQQTLPAKLTGMLSQGLANLDGLPLTGKGAAEFLTEKGLNSRPATKAGRGASFAAELVGGGLNPVQLAKNSPKMLGLLSALGVAGGTAGEMGATDAGPNQALQTGTVLAGLLGAAGAKGVAKIAGPGPEEVFNAALTGLKNNPNEIAAIQKRFATMTEAGLAPTLMDAASPRSGLRELAAEISGNSNLARKFTDRERVSAQAFDGFLSKLGPEVSPKELLQSVVASGKAGEDAITGSARQAFKTAMGVEADKTIPVAALANLGPIAEAQAKRAEKAGEIVVAQALREFAEKVKVVELPVPGQIRMYAPNGQLLPEKTFPVALTKELNNATPAGMVKWIKTLNSAADTSVGPKFGNNLNKATDNAVKAALEDVLELGGIAPNLSKANAGYSQAVAPKAGFQAGLAGNLAVKAARDKVLPDSLDLTRAIKAQSPSSIGPELSQLNTLGAHLNTPETLGLANKVARFWSQNSGVVPTGASVADTGKIALQKEQAMVRAAVPGPKGDSLAEQLEAIALFNTWKPTIREQTPLRQRANQSIVGTIFEPFGQGRRRSGLAQQSAVDKRLDEVLTSPDTVKNLQALANSAPIPQSWLRGLARGGLSSTMDGFELEGN